MRRTTRCLVMGVFVSFVALGVSAQEGVCEVLKKDATPGLYGLCVAFCEAQECEPEEPIESCTPGSQRVLEQYNKMKQAGDPEMPCISQTACPCWTEQYLEYRGSISNALEYHCTNEYSYDFYLTYSPMLLTELYSRRGTYDYSHFRVFDSQEDLACYLYDRRSYYSLVRRYLSITEEEYVACREQLKHHSAEWQFSCFE